MSTTPVANLPPVSTTPVANFATSSPCAVDTGGKFATGVNDTGGKFAADVNDAGGKFAAGVVDTGVFFKGWWGVYYGLDLSLSKMSIAQSSRKFCERHTPPQKRHIHRTPGQQGTPGPYTETIDLRFDA